MELRLGLATRATKDFDVVFRGGSEALLAALDEAFKEPYSGFTFRRSGEPQEIRETRTLRQDIKITFAGRGWQTLTMEIARPEGKGGGDPEVVTAAVSVRELGLDSPDRIALMALRYQVAQKLHAVSERPVERENPRYWDLIDLLLVRDLLEDLRPVREACAEVFQLRGAHAWPPALDAPEHWREPYAREAAELRFEPTGVNDAVTEVLAMIADIDAAA
jgi:hypothetical protein